MKHAHVVANERLPHQESWGSAFGAGLRRHGWQVTASSRPEPCDLMVIWGVRQRQSIEAQKRAGGRVCVLERGYVGDRFTWTSVSFGGGLNGRAEFRGPHHDGSRWERRFARFMWPWCGEDGGYALLAGQVPGDMSLAPAGGDLARWYYPTLLALRDAGWDVRFRPHPSAVERGMARPPELEGIPTVDGTLADALREAGLAVTFNSNTAVESVLEGVPTVAMDEGSMAWPVCGHAVGEVVMPDRTAWAHRLAWCQWRRDEMASGECWEAVGRGHARG